MRASKFLIPYSFSILSFFISVTALDLYDRIGKNDEVQFNGPDFEGGANEVSLRQAQKNFIAFGACEECFVRSVRKPTSEDVKDASWKQI
ncbi:MULTISPECIES: CPCC family cysteine-rich protein [Bacillus]|uniref:CPCC family cysteine-rich protein n=1 Tax=Bacillus TaxID=1386 RepID=UPI000869652D|nr:CPCC family cysteine-rich protein [Bacillus wiedmannii]MCU5516625.1 CPCC family cysteine-rich protein [Bacillus wiedmannii]MCU5706372.1 CPCC family cysteine-rich protein [Bacillus wiedmannii]PEJ70479.1 hypothetical protein CN888_22420 [Bacillus wiedmannii]PEP48442.1 hypothetical protein CN557_28335 [Bacillus wiedmannii]PFY91800.1 hypothetical protein COL57_27985 [Bacillus wiedmannii]